MAPFAVAFASLRDSARKASAELRHQVRVDRDGDDRDTWGPGAGSSGASTAGRRGMAAIEIGNYGLDGTVTGSGPSVLFLHGCDYVVQNARFLEILARRWQVTAPCHPGFGHSPRPEQFRTVHDVAYLYLDWLDRLPSAAMIVGSSFGGWVALEIAVRSVEKIAALVLVDALGLKFGGPQDRDIADIYALPEDEVRRRTFFDPARAVPDYGTLSEAELTAIACDRQATALYGWRPYLHDPGLKAWLHRVRVPSLVLWGENDGIVAPRYGEQLCAALPQARFRRIPHAGHYPQIERPEIVAQAIEDFAATEVTR
jgi:pimeloyl-ACP methyl ester carboxylesterase